MLHRVSIAAALIAGAIVGGHGGTLRKTDVVQK